MPEHNLTENYEGKDEVIFRPLVKTWQNKLTFSQLLGPYHCAQGPTWMCK